MPDAHPVARRYSPTALPSVTARALAFVAIIVGGICGGLIAYAITDLQCGSDDARAEVILPGPPGERSSRPPDSSDEGCTTIAGLTGLLGATASAGAVSVIVVLVLRAMGEWRRELAPDAEG